MIAYYELNNTQSYLFADYVSITEFRNFFYVAHAPCTPSPLDAGAETWWGGRDLRARDEDLFGCVEIFY